MTDYYNEILQTVKSKKAVIQVKPFRFSLVRSESFNGDTKNNESNDLIRQIRDKKQEIAYGKGGSFTVIGDYVNKINAQYSADTKELHDKLFGFFVQKRRKGFLNIDEKKSYIDLQFKLINDTHVSYDFLYRLETTIYVCVAIFYEQGDITIFYIDNDNLKSTTINSSTDVLFFDFV